MSILKPENFLMSPAETQRLLHQKTEQRKAPPTKWINRFWINRGETTTITFLDGDLDELGNWQQPGVFEHFVQISGRWTNVACLKNSGGLPDQNVYCPLCEEQDDSGGSKYRPYMGVFFSIIDHSVYVDRRGESHTNQTKVLLAKSMTSTNLLRHAQKRGGLRGVKFEVTRSDIPTSAAVGDQWEFEEKISDVELAARYPDIEVIDYSKAINVMSRAELEQAGFGINMIRNENALSDEELDKIL